VIALLTHKYCIPNATMMCYNQRVHCSESAGSIPSL